MPARSVESRRSGGATQGQAVFGHLTSWSSLVTCGPRGHVSLRSFVLTFCFSPSNSSRSATVPGRHLFSLSMARARRWCRSSGPIRLDRVANPSHSRQSLKKYVKANNNINATDNMFDSLFNKALKAGVDKGVFEQPKGTSSLARRLDGDRRLVSAY